MQTSRQYCLMNTAKKNNAWKPEYKQQGYLYAKYSLSMFFILPDYRSCFNLNYHKKNSNKILRILRDIHVSNSKIT